MFVVFDIETTGFSEITCDVIQFAYIMFDENMNFVKSEQLYFYYEGMSWSEEAYRVHQIPLEFLKTHKDKFKENLIKMYSVLRNANVIGHNAHHFDCPFCKVWLMRQGIRNLEYRVIQDTMVAFRPLTKKPRIKLTKLAEFVGITPEYVEMMMASWFPTSTARQAHDAAYDVTLTAILTLYGISKKLITFEPLVKLSQDDPISQDLMSDLNDSKGTVALDPEAVLFKVNSSNSYVCLPTDCSKYAVYEMDVPDNVVQYYKSLGRVIDVPFSEEFEPGDKIKKYKLFYKDVEFIVTFDGNGSKLSMVADYGTYDSSEVNMSLIIQNLFGGV